MRERHRQFIQGDETHLLVGRKQLHRKKTNRQKESEYRLTGKRIKVEQTHQTREFAAAQQLHDVMQDTFLGETLYTQQMKTDKRVEAELDPIFNAVDAWKNWQRGERYLTPTEIAEQEAALGIGKEKALPKTPTKKEIQNARTQQKREALFNAAAYGDHPKTHHKGSAY